MSAVKNWQGIQVIKQAQVFYFHLDQGHGYGTLKNPVFNLLQVTGLWHLKNILQGIQVNKQAQVFYFHSGIE